MSRSEPTWLACLMLLAIGCGDAETRLEIDLPEPARGRVRSIEVRVFPAGGEGSPCDDLADWMAASCALDRCPAAGEEGFFRPSTQRGEPVATSLLSAGPDGALGGRVRLGRGDGAWSILAVATLEPGPDVLLGCNPVVVSGEGGRIVMRWPWCAAAPCDLDAYHPACRPTVRRDCADPLGTRDPGAVDCRPLLASVEAYEEDGVPCAPPDGSSYFGACRRAVIECAEGGAIEDGLCPQAESCVDDVMVYEPGLDLDCDGRLVACAPCMRGDPRIGGPCTAGGCAGRFVCDEGELSCGDIVRADELCNGVDEDCDVDVDEAPAVDDCNVGRAPGFAIADGCAAAECRCGGGPACTGGDVCCTGVCTNIYADRSSCGRCGAPCAADQRCEGGRCTTGAPLADAGPPPECVVPADCNRIRADGLPRADLCIRGACRCGIGPACDARTEACCGGVCVDANADVAHCGRCGRRCPTGCIGGACTP